MNWVDRNWDKIIKILLIVAVVSYVVGAILGICGVMFISVPLIVIALLSTFICFLMIIASS